MVPLASATWYIWCHDAKGQCHRQSQRKRNIKTKLTFFLMSSQNQPAPCCHCYLCSSWGDPSSSGLGPGSSEEQMKSFLVWVLPVHAPRYNILCSPFLEVLIVPWTCHTFSGLHCFSFPLVFWLEWPFLPAPYREYLPIHGTFHDFLSREDASIHLIKAFIVKDYLQVCFHARLISPISRTLYY